MQKVELVVKVPDWEKKAMVDTTVVSVVGSTKSRNILKDEHVKNGEIVAKESFNEIWLDRNLTEIKLEELAHEQFDEGIAPLVAEYLKAAFDRLCVYYVPVVRGKKK